MDFWKTTGNVNGYTWQAQAIFSVFSGGGGSTCTFTEYHTLYPLVVLLSSSDTSSPSLSNSLQTEGMDIHYKLLNRIFVGKGCKQLEECTGDQTRNVPSLLFITLWMVCRHIFIHFL